MTRIALSTVMGPIQLARNAQRSIAGATIKHQTLRVTPAVEAGIAAHVWSIEEIVNLLG